MITIAAENPLDADPARLIAGSEAELSALYPPEERFAFSPQELVTAGVHFLVLRVGGTAAACGGLAVCDGYGELKRIFVDPAFRGQGLAHSLLGALEEAARTHRLPAVRLETGIHQTAALGLYRARGYRACGAFGDYPADGASLFMELLL